jgi:hypothetical protein
MSDYWVFGRYLSSGILKTALENTMETDAVPETLCSESASYVTTDGQSASLSWDKAPIWGLRPDLYYCQIAGLLMWGAVSDERTDLSFTIAAGAHQRSHSRVRVPWDSRPYFTASDSRLPLSSPTTTRLRIPDDRQSWKPQ